ncbi:MAG: SsrA-binding protein SmpB [Patescibacteria group bacterium]|nr:SsrA-binding protein SmpB [Patescibacteria group bacterium]
MAKFFARNKKAFHNYEVIDKLEAGIVLIGAEVKSVKSGIVSLRDSFVRIDNGEAWLWNCNISQWKFARDIGYDPLRKRKMLLNSKEIAFLDSKVNAKNLTLIPLSMYSVRGKIKVEIGLCRGRKKYDKRRRAKERSLKKELHQKRRKFMV